MAIDKWAFFRQAKYEPHAAQRLFHESDARFRVAICGRRFGKALDISTPIPTPNGWRTMAELEVGDQVFDERGQPCAVTGVTDVMYGRPCYRLVFSDGSEIVADWEHQWLTWDKPARKALGDPRRRSKPRVVMTIEIAHTLKYGDELNHAVQVTQPLQYPEAKLLIDPYVLGVWLGDGHSAGGSITCFDQEILDEIERRGYVVSPQRRAGGYGVLGLHVQLRELGLLKNKHIPGAYLRASVSQRKDLLQGVMDTDGSCTKQGHCDLTMMRREVIDGVEELALGLGCKVVRTTRRAKLYDKDCGTAHRLGITAAFPLFKLSRKLAQQFTKPFSSSRGIRTIKVAERVDSVPVKCIEVDSPNHLYLAGRACIPTHNSRMAGMEYAATLLDPTKKVRGWIVGPTYDLGEKEFRVIWDTFSDLGILKDTRVKTSSNVKQGAMYIKLPWGSEVHVRSADHPQYLVGESLDWVIVSEAAKSSEETWTKYLRPALADKRGSAVFPSTPEGMNWLYDVWSWGQDPEFDEWDSWQFPTWVNDRVFAGRDDPEIINLEKQLSPEEFSQEIGAEFTAFKGRIYPEWSDAVNVIDRYEYDPALETYAGLDFGYSNPMGLIEFQVTPDDTIYVFREWYYKYRTVPDMVEEIKSRSNPSGYRCRNIFADAAAPDHVETVNRALVDDERQPFDGCTALPESKVDVMDGINAVREFMRPEPPKLYVDRSCKWFIREINNYKMAPEPRTGQVDSPNKPLKKHDHCLIADTLVETSTGQKSIADVRVGDLVWTRAGLRYVEWSGQTASSAEVVRVRVNDGRELVGTPDHQVLTDRGWMRLDALRYDDMLFAWNSGSNRTGRIGTEPRGMFGESIGGQFRVGTTSTTRTGAHATTRSRISNACPQEITNDFTTKASALIASEPTSIGYGRSQLSGIEVLKDALGTENMESALGKIRRYVSTNGSVSNVGSRLRLRGIASEIGSAPTSARALGGVLRALTTRTELVPGAEQSFASIATRRKLLAPVRVVSFVVEQTRQPVYDLRVAGEHEFFANGILVSNCMDALRYAIVHLFRLGCRRHLAEAIIQSRARHLVVSSSIIANSPEALPARAGDTMFSLTRGKQF